MSGHESLGLGSLFVPDSFQNSKKTCHFDIPSIIRQVLVSVKFLSAVLGPEMAAPILWTPRISAFFLQEKTSMSIQFLAFLGGGFCVLGGGGGSADFIFMGALGFADLLRGLQRGGG